MADDEISTEELLTMRMVPEQQADMLAVQAAFGIVPRPLTPVELLEWLAGMADPGNHATKPTVMLSRIITAARRTLAAAAVPTDIDGRCTFKAPAHWGVSGCLLPAGHPEMEHEHVKLGAAVPTRDGWPQAEDVRNPPMGASDMRDRVASAVPTEDGVRDGIAHDYGLDGRCEACDAAAAVPVLPAEPTDAMAEPLARWYAQGQLDSANWGEYMVGARIALRAALSAGEPR